MKRWAFAVAALAAQGAVLLRGGHALRWRLETFGLYMPSLPEARPWWRVNGRALGALLRQMPSYARWLVEMQAVRAAGARGFWHARTGSDAAAWESWLALSEL